MACQLMGGGDKTKGSTLEMESENFGMVEAGEAGTLSPRTVFSLVKGRRALIVKSVTFTPLLFAGPLWKIRYFENFASGR